MAFSGGFANLKSRKALAPRPLERWGRYNIGSHATFPVTRAAPGVSHGYNADNFRIDEVHDAVGETSQQATP